MMPNNTPPPDNQKLQDTNDATEQSTDTFVREHALMRQLLANRQQPQAQQFDTYHQEHESSQQYPNNGTMLPPGLNESMMMGYSHQQQHDNLRHPQHGSLRHPQHDTQHHSYSDAGSLPRDQLSQHLSGMQQHHPHPHPHPHNVHDNLTGGLGMHQFSGGGDSFGHFENNGHTAMRQNMNQAHRHHHHHPHGDHHMLSMMLMASGQPNVPPVFNTMLNPNEQGEISGSSAVNEADMFRVYNQSLSQALMAAANQPPQQQQSGYSGHASPMAPSYPSVNMNTSSLHQRPSNVVTGSHHPPPMYHHPHAQPGINRNIGHNRFGDSSTGPAQFPGDIPERIEPNVTLGHGGILDIPYGIQQQRLLELGVGRGKRPSDGAMHQDSEAHTPDPPKKKKRRSQRKKPADMPRRPLSAYNLFFSAERQRILKEIEAEETGGTISQPAEENVEEAKDTCQALLRPLVPTEAKRRPHRKTHGKIGFQTLAQMVGQRWKQLSTQQRTYYQGLADRDMIRHKDAMEAYYTKQSEEKETSTEAGEKEKEVKKKADQEKEDDGKKAKAEEAKKGDDERGQERGDAVSENRGR